MFIAVFTKVVADFLRILLMEGEYTESSEKDFTDFEYVKIIPAVETAEKNFADLVEKCSLDSQSLCFVSFAFI